MKICFFNSADVWGGGEKWHHDMSSYFLHEGHDVTVVSNKNSELLKKSQLIGIKSVAFKISNLSFLNPFLLVRIYAFFCHEKFDVLIMNFSKDLKVAAPMAKLAGVKKIIYRRGSAIPIKNTLLNKLLYRHCLSGIIANSEATKKTILQNNNDLFPSDKIEVIYNGIFFDEIVEFKQNINSIPVIGMLGRLSFQKRFDLFIDIAHILKSRGIICSFVIGGDGELRSSIEKKIKALGMENDIILTGFIDDPDSFMKKIDIFVLTSEWEGFGYVLAEAMRNRKPLVAFDTSSNPELVKNDVNGYLIHWCNKNDFADKLELLIDSSDLREKFGCAGYNLAYERFNIKNSKKLVMNFLTK